MRRRRFGPTGVEVPILGIGTWQMERDDRGQAIAAIRRALELGMTHVDTAEMYGKGDVETMVGEAIRGQRDRVYLASKVLPKNAGYDATIRACEGSLRRLGTDRLDLYMLHWRGDAPLADTVRAFEALREQGKICAWGVSNFDDGDVAEVTQLGTCACNQVLYHLRARTIEHRVIPACRERGIAVVAYSPFGSRSGFPRSAALDGIAKRAGATPRQVALAFLLRLPDVWAIPKSSNPAHVDELAAAHRLALDDTTIAEIDKAFPAAPWRGLETI
ncbi:MAG: aldo/keto reductase [Deltaproteobacteria bacterium]|nr:aldo/keto reductase [Deltaproteobacteria bacterium]